MAPDGRLKDMSCRAAMPRMENEWKQQYRVSPVLLETFVHKDRLQGTCYRAANRVHAGMTQGRGKLDREFRRPLPVKHIFLYPLQKNFRAHLCSFPEIIFKYGFTESLHFPYPSSDSTLEKIKRIYGNAAIKQSIRPQGNPAAIDVRIEHRQPR
jgi:hypothetical protein